jgi:hypothetical protein
LLDPSDSLSGYSETVRHLTAAGFDLKGEKAHEAVGGQLTKKSSGSFCRQFGRPMNLPPDEVRLGAN